MLAIVDGGDVNLSSIVQITLQAGAMGILAFMACWQVPRWIDGFRKDRDREQERIATERSEERQMRKVLSDSHREQTINLVAALREESKNHREQSREEAKNNREEARLDREEFGRRVDKLVTAIQQESLSIRAEVRATADLVRQAAANGEQT